MTTSTLCTACWARKADTTGWLPTQTLPAAVAPLATTLAAATRCAPTARTQSASTRTRLTLLGPLPTCPSPTVLRACAAGRRVVPCCAVLTASVARYSVEISAEAPSLRTNTQTAPQFVVDNTEALTGTINDGEQLVNGTIQACRHCSEDADYTANGTTFFTNWCCGFEDPESGVVAYEWALSRVNFTNGEFSDAVAYNASLNNTENVLLTPWERVVSVGNGTGRADFIDPIADRTTVYVCTPARFLPSALTQCTACCCSFACVRTLNGAGIMSQPFCSDGVTVDTTPPEEAYVYVMGCVS